MKNERGPTSETRLAALSELPEINDFNSGPLAARTRNDTRTALFERVSLTKNKNTNLLKETNVEFFVKYIFNERWLEKTIVERMTSKIALKDPLLSKKFWIE